MHSGHSKLLIVVACLLMAAVACLRLFAQAGLDPEGDPAYGSESLWPGFTPAPFSIELFSGGSNNAAVLKLGDNCLGYVATEPDFAVELADEFAQVTLLVDSKLDTTLIVNTPNGSWACNDDTNGLNPAVVLRDAAAGAYQIWIGSYEQDASEIGTLWITELGPDTLPTTSTGPDRMQLPTWGEYALAPGFQPPEYGKQVVGGGRNYVPDFVSAEGCAGYVAEAPDFSITLNADFESIWFSAHSPANIVLLLNGPNGQWHCNDDFIGSDPSIGFSNAPAGRYDIWVGGYDENNYAASIIYVTEYQPHEFLEFNIDTSCPGALPTDLQVGYWAVAMRDDADSVTMHSAPNAATSDVFHVENGTRIQLIGGPICADEQRWWRVALFDVPRGWMPDGDSEGSWLEWTDLPVGETNGDDSAG